MATDTIDINSHGASANHYSSNSSIGSRSRSSRFKYRGRLAAVKVMNQLPPVTERNAPIRDRSFRFIPLNKNRRAVWYSFFAVFVYLCIGTLAYSLWVPGWSVIDALYFSMATMTSVGYGDIHPVSDGQRVFTIFYILLGMIVSGGILFGFLFDHLYGTFEGILRESKAKTSNYFLERLDNGGPEGIILEEEPIFWVDILRTAGKTAPWLVALIVPPLIMGYYEDWNVLMSVYFTVISFSTGMIC